MQDPPAFKIPKKVVVITGAASGLGLSLTKICLGRGMSVVMADVQKDLLDRQFESLKDEYSVIAVECDVSQAGSVSYLAEQTRLAFNRVDWLINNAGISGSLAPLWELSIEEVQKVIAVNLKGVIHGIQAFTPLMFKQSHRSHIINIASVYGLLSGSLVGAYAMTKHAIVALTESLFFDLHRLQKPVDVSVVCPSFSNTSLLKNALPTTSKKFNQRLIQLMEQSKPVDDLARHIIDQIELKRFYILPDREVKDYLDDRVKSILNQEDPFRHSLEKIITAISNE